MNEKDHCFQFYRESKGIIDSGLITKEEASKLWAKYKPIFVECVKNNEEAEVAIWQNMYSDTDFTDCAFDIKHDDCVIERGYCFVKKPLPTFEV